MHAFSFLKLSIVHQRRRKPLTSTSRSFTSTVAFWSISIKVKWFHGLKDKYLNCATHATLIRCNSLTIVHDVTWDSRHVQRHCECFCECDHDGILWTERLNLIHTKTPSFWCVSTCATNPWLSHEHLPESHSTTISCFTVLCKKNMIHICFLSPISHFFHFFPLHTSVIRNGSCEAQKT